MADGKKRKYVHVAISDPALAEHLEAACEVHRVSANRYMGRLLRADMERRGEEVRRARDRMRELATESDRVMADLRGGEK
jgi:hypothetical protein